MNAHDGSWYNEHGSKMTLEIAPDGQLEGTFESALGLAAPGERFPVAGFASGDLVAFTVNFGKYLSLTSWVGYRAVEDDGDEVLRTTWQMAVSPPAAKMDERWKGTWTGTNLFRRQPHAEKRLPSRPEVTSRTSAAPLAF
jgi:hypothetical protein